MRIDRVVMRSTTRYGRECPTGDFLIGLEPYDGESGLDWSTALRVAWYFQSDKWRTYVNGSYRELGQVPKDRGGSAKEVSQRTPAEQAYDILAREVAGMSPAEGTPILRSSPKRNRALGTFGRDDCTEGI